MADWSMFLHKYMLARCLNYHHVITKKYPVFRVFLPWVCVELCQPGSVPGVSHAEKVQYQDEIIQPDSD